MNPKLMTDAELLTVLCGPAGAALAAKPLHEVFGFARPTNHTVSDTCLSYVAHPQIHAARELMTRAMLSQLQEQPVNLGLPNQARDYMRAKIGCKPYEVFYGLYLDCQMRLICVEELFRGSIKETSVYPREVAVTALQHNASAFIACHNHPSGDCSPSAADENLTQKLKATLSLIDVRVIDHIIVSHSASYSFAESGLL